ncbi:MAG: two-component regulator propeller domain-containing protein [Candidatus Latescibacteria bacterium]|jgi:hypothetical protein|nr:two-component regulator propeller domain-containing protein [Candidatus Latescibacterota bacterium]
MLRPLSLLSVLVLAAASPAVAVDTLQVTSPDPVTESWRWTRFDRGNGLASGVCAILQDRNGHVWIGTDPGGVQRYDGYHWTTYTMRDGLGSNDANSLLEGQDGAIWLSTIGGGINRFDGRTWTNFGVEDGLTSPRTWPTGLAQAFDGTVWAGHTGSRSDTTGTWSGISRFSGEAWASVAGPEELPRPRVLSACGTADGSMWFTTFDGPVLRLNGSNWSRYTSQDGLAGPFAGILTRTRDGVL